MLFNEDTFQALKKMYEVERLCRAERKVKDEDDDNRMDS